MTFSQDAPSPHGKTTVKTCILLPVRIPPQAENSTKKNIQPSSTTRNLDFATTSTISRFAIAENERHHKIEAETHVSCAQPSREFHYETFPTFRVRKQTYVHGKFNFIPATLRSVARNLNYCILARNLIIGFYL